MANVTKERRSKRYRKGKALSVVFPCLVLLSTTAFSLSIRSRYRTVVGFTRVEGFRFRQVRKIAMQGERHPLDTMTKSETLFQFNEVVDCFGRHALEHFRKSEAGQLRWIRVEKEPDENLIDVGRQEIFAAIDDARAEQGKLGRADLYEREWVRKAATSAADDDAHVNGGASSENSFSVMQFNTLAEGLSCGSSVKRPFHVNTADGKQHSGAKQVYGGFCSIPHPSVVLDFSRRRWRVIEVILGPKREAMYDLIALEEVDRFFGFFLPVLHVFGYEGVFAPKIKSPGVSLGWYSDGCCLFWKRSKFSRISESRHEFQVGNQVYLVVTLQHLPTNTTLLVIVTHLKAEYNAANEEIRCSQVKELIRVVQDWLDERNDPDLPVLVLGDFNADPPSQLTGGEPSSVKTFLTGESEGGSVSTRLPFKSAYDIDPPCDNYFTTWKSRGQGTVKRVIDYIFYRGRLKCNATLKEPPADELEPSKLPGLRQPSDHLMIAAQFDMVHRKD